MTSKEFVLWLKGFSEGVHEFNVTPKQWDTLKEQLAHVDDNTIPMGGLLNDHNTFRKNKYSDAIDVPMPNPYGTRGPETPTGTTITTTPGVGSITIANPPFGFGSTSTAYGYPSGSAWSYTNSTWKPEQGPDSPTIQNINQSLGESLEELENDFFGSLDGEDGWTPDLEKQFWAEQPPEPFATPEELAKYNIDSEGFENPSKER